MFVLAFTVVHNMFQSMYIFNYKLYGAIQRARDDCLMLVLGKVRLSLSNRCHIFSCLGYYSCTSAMSVRAQASVPRWSEHSL